MKINEVLENTATPELVVMIGLPGSGKSTLIKNRYPNYTIVSSDDIIEKLSAEEGLTYDEGFQKHIGNASSQMKSNFRNAVKNNESIVWDQTNLTKKKRRGILDQIPKHYKKVAVVFSIPDKVRYERAAQRSGKSIPDNIIKSMENSYQPVTKDEGFDEIIVIRK